jgi:hypothetical protein
MYILDGIRKGEINMQLKNEVFEMGIVEALKTLQETDMPIKEGFKVLKLLGEVQKAGDDYMKAKEILLKKYGTVNKDNPSMYNFTPENGPIFAKEMQSLLGISFDVGTEKIQLPSTIKLKPRELKVLEPAIELKE